MNIHETYKSYFNLNENNEIIFSILNYDHEKDDINILFRQKVSNKLKRKALDDLCEKPCKILQKKLRQGDISSPTTTDRIRISTKKHSSWAVKFDSKVANKFRRITFGSKI